MGPRQDLRDAYRALRASRRTALTIVLTLAVALGLNTTLVSVIEAVLLRPLPYPRADRLVVVAASWPARHVDRTALSAREVGALKQASAFDVLAAGMDMRQNLTGHGAAQQVVVGWVADDFLPLLGARAEAGRLFAVGEPPGRAILSHAQALRTFGGSEAAVGGVVQLDAHPYEIVGVLAPGFRLHAPNMADEIDVWKVPDPWWQNGQVWDPGRPNSSGWFTVLGRLRDGVTLERARAEAAAIASRERQDNPGAAERGLEFSVEPLLDRVVGGVRRSLLLIWAAVAVLVAIACANVINLLLVRIESRRRDMAIRQALGAGAARILQLLVMEGAILATAGAIGGTVLALAAIRPIHQATALGIPRFDEVRLDWRILAMSAAVTAACTVLLGLAPFATVVGTRVRDTALTMRSVTGRLRLTRGLVVVQIALSMVLLAAAGLLAASLMRLGRVSPGFDPEHLLTFSVSLPGKKYTWPEGADVFHRTLEERVRTLPGVENAAVIWPLPLSGSRWGGRYVGGDVTAQAPRTGAYRLVTPAYFATMRLPIVEGRNFGADDPKKSVIVSRSLAARAFGGRSALGRQVMANPWGRQAQPMTIIGVAADVRMSALREPPDEALYFDSKGWAWTEFEVDVVVRTATDPMSLAQPVRDALAAMDADVPMAEVRPMRAWVDAQLSSNRAALWLVGGFALIAAFLAAVGLYGILSYLVTRTRRELAIRMALGAGTARIYRFVLGRAARLVAAGIGIGLALSLATSRLLGSYLFEVESRDPRTIASVAIGLTIVAVVAAYLPARHAAGTAPSVAITLD